jgi:hypothetical protein
MNQPDSTPAVPPPLPASAHPAKACGNCGAPLNGPYCYACGQPEKGMIRHLASVLSDAADTIFNVDSRIFRSLVPLYFRPGFLTAEYFAGRRTRYVTPFRLFFFLCVIAFFAIQASLNLDDVRVNRGEDEGLAKAQTSAQVDERLQAALDQIGLARKVPGVAKPVLRRLDKDEASLRKQADQRRAWIAERDKALASGAPPPPDPVVEREERTLSFDGQPWDPVKHPIKIGWLPDFANAKLNEMVGRGKANVIAAERDPRHLVAGLFSVLPQTLFVLMPLFAVLLKIIYLFKRRLYMEHLMVALHSHAFIFLSLLLLAVVHLLGGWWADTAAQAPLRLLSAAIWIWLPIYLLLMQKRIYRQGWIMTVLKYGVIGTCYIALLSMGLVGALLVSLTSA